uniref:Uncharacterized protein n=1 Tax=viral metagenome TaxID=1070528 RepID=A0A6M3LCH4_9ZZZZ
MTDPVTDVHIVASKLPSGAATEATLLIVAGDTTSIDGKITACNTGAITGSVTANAGTNLNTSTLVTEVTMAKQLAFNAVTTIMYVDEPDAATTYQGWAVAGTATAAASWMIRRVLKTGTVTSVLWCDGNQNYDNIWNNRAALAYS